MGGKYGTFFPVADSGCVIKSQDNNRLSKGDALARVSTSFSNDVLYHVACSNFGRREQIPRDGVMSRETST